MAPGPWVGSSGAQIWLAAWNVGSLRLSPPSGRALRCHPSLPRWRCSNPNPSRPNLNCPNLNVLRNGHSVIPQAADVGLELPAVGAAEAESALGDLALARLHRPRGTSWRSHPSEGCSAFWSDRTRRHSGRSLHRPSRSSAGRRHPVGVTRASRRASRSRRGRPRSQLGATPGWSWWWPRNAPVIETTLRPITVIATTVARGQDANRRYRRVLCATPALTSPFRWSRCVLSPSAGSAAATASETSGSAGSAVGDRGRGHGSVTTGRAAHDDGVANREIGDGCRRCSSRSSSRWSRPSRCSPTCR